MNQIYEVFGDSEFQAYRCDPSVYQALITQADNLFQDPDFPFDEVIKFWVGEWRGAQFYEHGWEGDPGYIEVNDEFFVPAERDYDWQGPHIRMSKNTVQLYWFHKLSGEEMWVDLVNCRNQEVENDDDK